MPLICLGCSSVLLIMEYNLPVIILTIMKEVSKAINDFITEFDLAVTAEGVCFDAVLFIYTKYLAAQVESEVHIVSIGDGNINTIQILDPAPGIDSFPSKFEAGYVSISYQPQKGLIIRGSTVNFGAYKLIIYPIKAGCKNETEAEIKARYYN